LLRKICRMVGQGASVLVQLGQRMTTEGPHLGRAAGGGLWNARAGSRLDHSGRGG